MVLFDSGGTSHLLGQSWFHSTSVIREVESVT